MLVAATAACSVEAVSRCKSDTRIARPNQDGSLFQPMHEELNGPPRIAAILYNGPWVAGYSETVKEDDRGQSAGH